MNDFECQEMHMQSISKNFTLKAPAPKVTMWCYKFFNILK